jgi:hypothetical protein
MYKYSNQCFPPVMTLFNQYSIAPEVIGMAEGSHKVSTTLTQKTFDDLNVLGCSGSLSKKIRVAIEIYLVLRREIENSGEVFVKRNNNKLYRVDFSS